MNIHIQMISKWYPVYKIVYLSNNLFYLFLLGIGFVLLLWKKKYFFNSKLQNACQNEIQTWNIRNAFTKKFAENFSKLFKTRKKVPKTYEVDIEWNIITSEEEAEK